MSDEHPPAPPDSTVTVGEPLQVRRIPVPELRPGHVLVRVEASGVNPLDTKIRAGVVGHARTEPPAILGIDLAGTIETVVDDATRFAPGDQIYGMTGPLDDDPGN